MALACFSDASTRFRGREGLTALTPIESEFATTEEAEAYDCWFRAKVKSAMADGGAKLPHDEAMAKIRDLIAGRWRPQDD